LEPGALRSDFRVPEDAGHFEREAAAGGEAEIVVTSVGRIHPRKGQLALLEAAGLLPEAVRKRVRIRLAGRVVVAEYQEQLKRLAGQSGVAVDFLGEVSDAELPRIYAQSDIFAMTSLPLPRSIEGFGLVYLEAGACGLPVLAHDTGGVSDAVIDGETGLLVSPGDRQALSGALRRLVEDGALRRRLGENGRRHARSFSWAQNAARLFIHH
jgi:glycosyltransferase involved in cell wall biosynthesis